MKSIRYIFSLLWCLAYMALASEVKLAWDANPEPDVSYRLSYGLAAGTHPTVIEAGKSIQATVPDLVAGTTYYFVVQAVGPDGLTSLPSAELEYTVPKPSPMGWVVRFVDDEQVDGYGAERAIDADPSTIWHTTWKPGQVQTPMPHEIQIDMKSVKVLAGFTHLPRQDEFTSGDIKDYDFYLSTDGSTWGNPVASGAFPPGKALVTVPFPAQAARYFRLVAKSNHEGTASTAIAELSVVESITPPPPVLPAAPKNLRVVEIQTSQNLTEWRTIAMIPQDPSAASAEFVRARITAWPN